jgi:hypothetical protein
MVVAVGVSIGVRLSAGWPIVAPDQAQVHAMMPTITAYLQSPAYRDLNGEYPSTAYQTGRVRWLCTAAIVYIDSDGTHRRAGMDVACGDYDRRGNMVIMEDGGDMGHEVIVLSGDQGHYQVLTAAQEPGVSPDPAWIDQNFPAFAAAEVNHGLGPMASTPDSKALLAFGCTTGSTQGSVIPERQGGAAWGWPCASP